MALRQRCLGLVAGALKASSSGSALCHASRGSVPSALAIGSAPRGWVLRGCLGSLRPFSSDLPEHTELAMPALSPTMERGNILEWKKKVGDSIAPGDVYCEVETDKASMEWEAQEEGFLAKIVAPDNTKDIPVGQVVAVLVEDENDIAAFADFEPGSAAAASKKPAEDKPAAASAPKKSPGKSWPPHEVLAMPALSPTMEAGNILSWKKKVGDTVAPGDVWAEVETDKASMDWESQEEGVVAQILVPDGAQGIAVGQPVVVLVEEGAEVEPFAEFTAADAEGGAEPAPAAEEPKKPEPKKPEPKKAAPAAKKPAKAAAPASGERVVASPYAKKLAAEAGVSLSGVAGSGEGGRVVASDVRELVESGAAQASGADASFEPVAGEGAFTDIPHSQIRRVTAQRLLQSKQQVPHYYLTASARVDALLALRGRLNKDLAAVEGGKLSVNDFIIKAAALTLRRFPDVNASWHGDFIRQYADVDVSIAVQTPAGLMVPIVRDADLKGLSAISADVKALAGKAKEGKLRPEEFTGGTFTISNLGMYGVKQFAAIINPPQACILAVGAAQPKVVRAADGAGFEEAQVLEFTLSCDHRVVDGALGAQWLQVFKRYLENPASMLL